MQCHILGIALLPVVAVPSSPMRVAGRCGRSRSGIVAIFALAYLPLLVNELTTGGSEVRAALDYLAAGRTAGDVAIPVRFAIAGLRVLSWPLTGLITEDSSRPPSRASRSSPSRSGAPERAARTSSPPGGWVSACCGRRRS